MALAQYVAGMGFSNVGLGIVHSMAHGLGALYDTPHGVALSLIHIFKGILQNPVYLVADQAAYRYFIQRQADVFSNEREFDGVHGVLAYNRTDQSKGKNTVYLPVSEWIVSVGKHRGLISSEVWLEAQAALEHNRSKAYRRPRSNEALLTGLLFCRCGGRMYPKLSKRSLADGTRSYTYVCREKERSRRSLCDGKNADGNMLDSAVLQAIGALAEDKAGFAGRLAQSKGGSMGGPGPVSYTHLACDRRDFCFRKRTQGCEAGGMK